MIGAAQELVVTRRNRDLYDVMVNDEVICEADTPLLIEGEVRRIIARARRQYGVELRRRTGVVGMPTL